MKSLFLAIGVFLLGVLCVSSQAEEKLKVLIVDGQNNHDWKACTPVLKSILEESGRFTVDVSTSPSGSRKPDRLKADATPEQTAQHVATMAQWTAENEVYEKTKAELWKKWSPKFFDYAVVVSNYNGDAWPESVKADFVNYVRNGGGLVSYHAADNSFSDWPEFNEMIGLGGWGGRNEKSGPMIRFRDGKIVRDETPGSGGTHGKNHSFVVDTYNAEHPIMKGLPLHWKHASDELYSKLRGPAKNLTVLATAFAAPEQNGTGEVEPILMTIDYGKGRVFHTTLGHSPSAMEDVGFQVTLLRGTEWAATGKVTIPAPKAEEMSAETVVLHKPTVK